MNRSQKDIIELRTMADARAKEEAYFTQHAAYSSLAKSMGTAFLVQRLSSLLVRSIQRELPGINAKVKALITAKEVSHSFLMSSLFLAYDRFYPRRS